MKTPVNQDHGLVRKALRLLAVSIVAATCIGTSQRAAAALVNHINPCAARTSDGRLTVFAIGIGTAGTLYQNYQTSPGGSWSGWVAMGSGNTWNPYSIPAVGVNADGRLEVFVVGTDGTINHIWQKVAGSSATTNWSTFNTFSSHVSTTAKLAVGNWANGSLDLFIVGTDGVLYHSYQTAPNGTWSGWFSLGGSWSQDNDIAIANDANGEEEIFMVGNTGNLYNNWQTSANSTSWSGWNDLSGAVSQTVRVAAARNHNGTLEVFTIGTDGVAYTKTQTGQNTHALWTAWNSLGGSWNSLVKPVVVADQNGALELFLVGNTGNVYHNFQTSFATFPTGSSPWFKYPICVPFGNPNYDTGYGGAHDEDVQTPLDTPITSIVSGTVSSIDTPSWGWEIGIQLDQPGTNAAYFAYLHLGAVNPNLAVGQYVAIGDLIAYSGGANSQAMLGGNTTTPFGPQFIDDPSQSSQPQTGYAYIYGPEYGVGAGWTSKPDFHLDPTGTLYQTIANYNAGTYGTYNWSGWQDINGSFTQSIRPCVGVNKSGTLQFFINIANGAMDTASQTAANSATWSSWTSLGGTWY